MKTRSERLSSAILAAPRCLSLQPGVGCGRAGAAEVPVNWHAIVMFLIFVEHHPGHHVLGGDADQDGDRLLRRRTRHHRLPERPGHRRRLHVGGLVPRHRRAGVLQRLLRPHLLGGLAGRLADHPVPDRGAAAQPRQVHLRRRRLVPAEAGAGAHHGGHRLADRRHLVPDRPGRGRRAVAAYPGAADVLPAVHRHRRRADHHLRHLRRHEGHDLGADHQGRPAAGRRDADGDRRDGARELQLREAVLRRGRPPIPSTWRS